MRATTWIEQADGIMPRRRATPIVLDCAISFDRDAASACPAFPACLACPRHDPSTCRRHPRLPTY